MKYILFGLLFAISIPAVAQQFNCMWETPEWPIGAEQGYHSTNGYIHTPKGELHVLVLFIGFTDITETILPNEPNEINHWPYNDLPNWAKGQSNHLFDAGNSTIGQTKNLSNWFKIMSKGQFTVTGEVFPEQIMLPASARDGWPRNGAQAAAWDYIKNNPAYANYPWANFDLRTNKNFNSQFNVV